jgi:four helix bundle protein
MKAHQKLKVWQRAIDFVTGIYKLTEEFPKEEMYGLIGQMRRAAVSIPSNIAEGAARDSKKSSGNFYQSHKGLPLN